MVDEFCMESQRRRVSVFYCRALTGLEGKKLMLTLVLYLLVRSSVSFSRLTFTIPIHLSISSCVALQFISFFILDYSLFLICLTFIDVLVMNYYVALVGFFVVFCCQGCCGADLAAKVFSRSESQSLDICSGIIEIYMYANIIIKLCGVVVDCVWIIIFHNCECCYCFYQQYQMEGQLILFPQLIFKIIKPKIIALLIQNSYSPIQLKMQALKNLFTKKQPEQTKSTESTFDHSKLTSSDDIAQCPFMKNKQQKQATQPKDLPKQDQGKCPYKGDKSTKPKPTQQGQSSQSEDQAPRGGCPFMGGSQRKRNPDLFQTPPLAYDQPFVSKFHYYLSSSKIDLTMLSAHNRKKSLPISRSREIFNTYPIYLQHSLFFNGEDYKKVRGIQCCSRFLPYDKLREKGNKLFNKGMYSQALQYYQRALSLFKWLQHYEQQPDDKKSQLNDSISHPSMSSLPSTQSLHNSSSSNVHINLTSQQQQKQQLFEKDEQLEEMKNKYKEFFVVYSDGNVRLFDGEEMEDQPDVDMRKSLMLQVLLNMAVAYSHLGHFSVALQCIDDCLHLSDKVSQVYLRKAQILIFNRGCSLQQALQAKHCIQKALHLKSTQKIFQSGQHVLKMINLHNAQQSYQKTLDLVNERVKAIQDGVNILTEKIYNRAREIHLVEQRLIQEGRTPYERHEEGIQRSKEFKILLRMKQKYIKVIEFYTESQNKQQVHLAKKQLQQLLRVFAQMNTIINLTINQTDQQLGGIHSQKIQRRIETIKKNHCEDIYNGGRFNFTVMEWAIKEIVKEERQEEEFKKREEEQGKRENGECVGEKVEKSGLVKMASWGLVLIPIVGILVNQFLLV